MPAPADDAALIPGLIAQDERAVEALVARYWKSAYGVALQWTNDPASAEDVAQETILAVLRSASTLREGSAFRPWFFQILRNTAQKHLRGEQRRAAREEARAMNDEVEQEPGAALEQSEEHALVRAHLLELSPKLRHTLALRFLEGMPLAEIARVLDVPRETVSSRIRRGLESLRTSLQPTLSVSVALLSTSLLEEALAALPTPSAPSAARLLSLATAAPSAAATAAPSAAAATALALTDEAPGAGRKAISLTALALGALALGGLAWVALRPAPDTASGEVAVSPSPGGTPATDATPTAADGSAARPTPAGTKSADPSRTPRVSVRGKLSATGRPRLTQAWVARLDPARLDLSNLFADVPAARRALGRARFGWNVPDGSTPVGSDGAFALTLPPGQHLLAAGARGARTRLLTVTLPAAQPLEVALEPCGAGKLSFEVVDDDGAPYAHCWVQLRSPARDVVWVDGYEAWAKARLDPKRAARSLGFFRRTALAPIQLDAQGRAELDWPAGSYPRSRLTLVEPTRLRDRCPFLMGSLDARLPALTVLADGVTPQRVRLSWRARSYRGHKAQVEVRVVDAAGQPVPGAWVQVQRDRGAATLSGLREVPGPWAWVTGPDGSVRIRGVKVGATHHVAARSGARFSGFEQSFRLEDAERLHVETVTLQQPFQVGQLRLRLVDAATGKAPASQGQVTAGTGFVQFQGAWDLYCEPRSGQPELGSANWRPGDRPGELRIADLSPGAWRVHIKQPRGNRRVSYLPIKVQVEIRAGETHTETVKIRPGATLRGRIRLAGAPPVQGGAQYAVTVIDPTTPRRFVVASPVLDAEGRFAASGLEAGRGYDVVVAGVPGSLTQTFPSLRPTSEPHELTLSTQVGLELKVQDDAGRPIAGAPIELRWGAREAKTDALGVVRWRGRLARPTRAQVWRYGYTPQKVVLRPVSGAPTKLTVKLSPAPQSAAIAGQVVGQDGAPLAGVRLSLSGILIAVTNAEGRFATRILSRDLGTSLSCERTDLPTQRVKLTPQSPAQTFRLKRGGRVQGTIKAAPAVLATVRRVLLRSASGGRGRSRVSPDGSFATPLLLPGTYTLYVQGRRKRDLLLTREVVVTADRDTQVVIDLP